MEFDALRGPIRHWFEEAMLVEEALKQQGWTLARKNGTASNSRRWEKDVEAFVCIFGIVLPGLILLLCFA